MASLTEVDVLILPNWFMSQAFNNRPVETRAGCPPLQNFAKFDLLQIETNNEKVGKSEEQHYWILSKVCKYL